MSTLLLVSTNSNSCSIHVSPNCALTFTSCCPRSSSPPTAAPNLKAKMQEAAAVRFLFGGSAMASSRSLLKFNTYLAFLRPNNWLFSRQHSLANHWIPVSHLVAPSCPPQLILLSVGCNASNSLLLR